MSIKINRRLNIIPYSLHHDPQKQWLISTFSQTLTPAELIQNDQEILDSKHLSNGIDLLKIVEPGCDLSGLTLSVFYEQFIPILRKTSDQRRLIDRTAWVLPNDAHASLFRLWTSLPEVAKLQNFQFFEDRAGAEAWLNEPRQKKP